MEEFHIELIPALLSAHHTAVYDYRPVIGAHLGGRFSEAQLDALCAEIIWEEQLLVEYRQEYAPPGEPIPDAMLAKTYRATIAEWIEQQSTHFKNR